MFSSRVFDACLARVIRRIWRGRLGERDGRSNAPVVLVASIPQNCISLSQTGYKRAIAYPMFPLRIDLTSIEFLVITTVYFGLYWYKPVGLGVSGGQHDWPKPIAWRGSIIWQENSVPAIWTKAAISVRKAVGSSR